MRWKWSNAKPITSRIKRALSFRSMIQPLALFTLLISLVPLAVNMAVAYRAARQLLNEELLQSYSLLTRQYTSQIEYKIRLHRDSLARLADNSFLRESLYAAQTGQYRNAYIGGRSISREVGSFLRSGAMREMINCMVYANSAPHAIYGSKVAPASVITAEGWYKYYIARESDWFFVPGDSPVFSMLQEIDYIDEESFTSHNVGFIKLDLDIKSLFDPLSGIAPDDYQYEVAVFQEDGIPIFTTPGMPALDIEGRGTDGVVLYEDGHISVASLLEAYGFRIYLFFDIGQVDARFGQLLSASVPYILLAVLAIALFTMLYARHLRGRIQALVNKMQKVESGDLRIAEAISGRDELHTLDKSFDRMLEKLDQSIQENYVQELEKKEARFRNLQLQINPHFLYNTLETVASIAEIHQIHEISDIASRLGEIFRYSLGRDTSNHATVRQELVHTQNYVFIQKARFGDQFEVLCDADEMLMERRILRFILQPLVENAILHGVTGKSSPGTIEITATERGNTLIFTVEDDGLGMTDEQVERLRQHIDSPEPVPTAGQGGIGIRNVHQRVRLAYGDGYGVEIERNKGGGSRFTITLPLDG